MSKTNVERRKDAERQARYWQRYAERQRAQIASLKEEMEGWKQLVEAGNALITGILMAAGLDAENPIAVDREMVNAAVRGENAAQVDLTKDGYKLHWVACGKE